MLSQGVRAFGLRRARYRGAAKTRLQNVAIAAALNLDRLAAWWAGRPLAPTRTSHFASLAAEMPLRQQYPSVFRKRLTRRHIGIRLLHRLLLHQLLHPLVKASFVVVAL